MPAASAAIDIFDFGACGALGDGDGDDDDDGDGVRGVWGREGISDGVRSDMGPRWDNDGEKGKRRGMESLGEWGREEIDACVRSCKRVARASLG